MPKSEDVERNGSSIFDGGPDENKPLLGYKSKKDKKQSRKLRNFYEHQQELQQHYEEDKERACVKSLDEAKAEDATRLRKDIRLAQGTFAINVLLLIAKTVVAYLTSSLSVISSVVDSAVDVTSGIVVWASTRAIEKHDPYLYPKGRSRLEPLAVIIVSVVMAVASLQIIIQAIEQILSKSINPSVDIPSLVIMGLVIVTKLVLFIVCWRQGTPSAMVLAVDHRNDLVSNIVATLCAFLADKYWLYIDPIGAIIVAIYIIVTWCFTGAEQVSGSLTYI